MARIYVDAWGIKGGPHGAGRYCRGLIPPLVAAAPQHEFIIVRPPRRTPADRIVGLEAVREVELGLPRTDWARLIFRPLLERAFRRHGPPDLYHSLFHMLPLALRRGRFGPRTVVVTLHDLICLDYADQVKQGRLATAWVKRFDRAVIPYALHHADHVICVSEATRQRATEWVPLDRSTTVHHGVDERLFAPRDDAGALPFGLERMRPYVAAFGAGRPYKNVACVVRAVAAARAIRPEWRLVLIGGDGGVAGLIEACGLARHTAITPPPNDRELCAIVAAARLFAVPSRIEGFGLPVIEAMAAGTPVAVSDIPVLREVAGEAALRFHPDEPDQLARIIGAMEQDSLRADMIARGLTRAAGFRWARTAAETLAVYERVIDNR